MQPLETSPYKIQRPSERQVRVASISTAEVLIQALLNAHRDGTLAEWMRQHRHMARWLRLQLLQPVLGSAGDALKSDSEQATALAWLLHWAVVRLRPDQATDVIGREEWLSRTSWRPMLSTVCHYGFEPVRPFRDRYHPQADESASSHLCGLWSVGPSTYYRYLEKAKRALASQWRAGLLDAEQRLSLRSAVRLRVLERMKFDDEDAAQLWHAAQVPKASGAGDIASALWHQSHAGNVDAFISLLRRCTVELANEVETDGLIDAMASKALSERQHFELLLASAALWHSRGVAEREQAALEQALRMAATADDALMLGRVYGELGKFHELRDADRAFAFFQDCTDELWRAGVGSDGEGEGTTDGTTKGTTKGKSSLPLVEEFVVSLVRLAWSYVLRNDPRSKIALDRAQALRERHPLASPTAAMLEQAWGEYWRRAGDLPRAIEHKHRALNLYEKAADRASTLKTYSNLSLLYGQAKDFARAIDYANRVLAFAQTMNLEPELLASTRLNLGVAHFWNGDLAMAGEQYQIALQFALRAQLRFIARTAHYNLAEVAYLQFKTSRDKADEARGDLHAEASLTTLPLESDPSHSEAIKKLKRETLGVDVDRLAPQEAVLYPVELAEVQKQREFLAVPSSPEPQVRAHLRIANAYLAVAMKEREAALTLMQRHGLGDRFTAELNALQTTFERELSLEQQLTRRWTDEASDLLSTARCNAVLARLILAGALNKSGYAELCALSPATASKHLATLAQRGLLTQTGKGPSTRYVLPDVGSQGDTGISTISR